jgi:hypothetical protein
MTNCLVITVSKEKLGAVEEAITKANDGTHHHIAIVAYVCDKNVENVLQAAKSAGASAAHTSYKLD